MKRRSTKWIILHRAEVGFPEYNAVVMRDGSIVHQHTDLDEKAAHAKDLNGVAYGLAFQGAFASCFPRAKYGTPSEAQLTSGAKFVASLVTRYGLAIGAVRGHSSFGTAGTRDLEKLKPENSCPGDRFPMQRFLALVRAALAEVG